MDDESIIDELIKLGVRIAPLQPSSLPMWGDQRDPFLEAPEVITELDWDITFQGSCFPTIVKPEAIVMVHPMVRNYYHIRQIEERTGRVAIAKMGYIELVKP